MNDFGKMPMWSMSRYEGACFRAIPGIIGGQMGGGLSY